MMPQIGARWYASAVMSSPHAIVGFRSVPRTGVIFVTTEAQRHGFRAEDATWCNLGQGQPETGPLPGAPARHSAISIDPDDQEYAPVAGLWELREAVAGHYNQTYRRGLPSQYKAENVSISGGGRSALTRAAAALGHVNLGHFLPDYTAYEELLDIFRLFSPIPILLDGERAYEFDAADLRREILGRGLSAVLLSNPCNPTGKLVSGDDLAAWVAAARQLDCALLIDEFYSHYVWRKSTAEPGATVSAARYVEDVDRDPVVLFDGLTKNWRYPGWRCTWTVGPRAVIDAVASAGSFLDGGGSKPLQRAAVELMSPAHVAAETAALQSAFAEKRELVIAGARRLGMTIDREPDGTFYVWARCAELGPKLSDGMSFFRAALAQKVIVVPGEFFDVNPGKRRAGRPSRFRQHVRLSFGPPRAQLELAFERLERLVKSGS
jgi:aspartate/methionine/tyrosine aminotransferase